MTTWSSRTIATKVASRGTSRSRIAWFATGASSARVTSTRPTWPPLELEQPHQPADAHGLVDERRDEVRGRHRDVDAPRLVEHPLVLRVVDARDDPRDRELLLREQRHDEVVLVVAGRGDDDVAALEARPPSATRPRTRRRRGPRGRRPCGTLRRDVRVAARGAAPRGRCSTSSLAMNVADVAGTRDRDAHQWCPCVVVAALRRSSSASSVVDVDHEVEDVALLADEVAARRSGRCRAG